MRKFHVFAALLLALLLFACGALAATKVDPAAAPNFTVTAPEGIVSGGYVALTVKPDLPGFLTLELQDGSGNTLLTIARNAELHTKENYVTFVSRDADGEAIPAGVYQIVGTMRSQFGVKSSTVIASLTLEEPEPEPTPQPTPLPEEPVEEPSEDGEDQAQDAEPEAADEDDNNDGDSSDNQPAASEPASAPSAPAEQMNYSSASLPVGEEGYQIGVGPSDVADQADAGYWGLSADSSDAQLWAALTRTMYAANVDERESAYIYDSPYEGRERIGTVSGLSQGLNLIAERSDGWSLVEAYRNEDGAFVRGYIRTSGDRKLRVVEPNTTYGIVIDKKTQTLVVFKDGQRVGSCAVTTGLPTTEYPHRETPAGEFITVTRHGTVDYANGRGFCAYAIRINGNYRLCEIPSTKKGGSDFSMLEGSLGAKGSRGDIAIAHTASSDGGINAKWLWDMTDTNKRVKVLIFDDKDRSEVPVTK